MSQNIDRNLDCKNLAIALDLYNNGPKKDHMDCKEFLAQRMWQVEGSSTNVIFKNNKPVIMSKEDLKDAITCKINKSIDVWHKQRIDMVELVCKPNQPVLHENQINMFGGFMHTRKPYSEYSDDIKGKVNLMLTFIKEVICSNDVIQFDYLIKWLSNMAQGNKNDSVLYLKGPEGLGKSTFSDYLRDWVIGTESYAKGMASHLLTDFNSMLRGKILVVFEELPVFSDQQWQGASSKLKDYVTGKVCAYSDKYEKMVTCENFNNYIINTNVNAIVHSEGRRWFILDLSTHRKGDYKYFDNLHKTCFNKEVGEAFYNYLISTDVSNFYAQDFPHTKAKAQAKIRNLALPFQFIKEKYILKKLPMKIKCLDLYNLYVDYLQTNKKSKTDKLDFYAMLQTVNITPKKSNGKHLYNVTIEQLEEIAKQGGWIHELDDIVPQKEEDDEDEAVDAGIDKTDKSIPQDEVTELKKQIEELKKQLKEALLKKEPEKETKEEKPKKKEKVKHEQKPDYKEVPEAKQFESIDKKELPNVFKMQQKPETKLISPKGINLAGLCD